MDKLDEDVRKALADAVRCAWEHDAVLFGERTHERSVMFHIGRYLAAEVARWEGPWTVDLEYNRWHPNGDPIWLHKSLQLPEKPDGRVFPDLIVHDRRGSSRLHNLLVLEAKYVPREEHRSRYRRYEEARAVDIERLRAFQRHPDYAYREAVFLQFFENCDPPRWQWFVGGVEDGDPVQL